MMDEQVPRNEQSTEQERRDAERLCWLERAEATLDWARQIAEGPHVGDPTLLAQHLKLMIDKSADACCLTAHDRQALILRARAIELIAYARAFEQLLCRGPRP